MDTVDLDANKSTTVRSFKVMSAIRPAAATLSQVAPSIAARAVEALLLRPMRFAPPPREREWLAGAEHIRFGFEGQELSVWARGEGPVVLLVHGWSGRGSQLGGFVEPLVEAGYRVVGFDLPGHGESAGKRSSLPEAARAVERLVEWLGGVHAVVAHSLGSAATSIALDLGARVGRLVYVSAPEDPAAFLLMAGRMVGFSEPVVERMRDSLEARFDVRFERLTGSALAPSIGRPLLVVHDTEDLEVPVSEARRLVAAWPGAEIRETRGLGHRRILRDAEVVRQSVAFVDGRLGGPARDLGRLEARI